MVLPQGIVEGNDSLADQSKNDLEKAVFQHGGDYQQSLPTQKERVVISGRKGFFVVDGAIRRGADIISPQWIIDSIKAQRRKPFSSRYVLSTFLEADVLIRKVGMLSAAREKQNKAMRATQVDVHRRRQEFLSLQAVTEHHHHHSKKNMEITQITTMERNKIQIATVQPKKNL